jgi:hypothetical protein
MVEIAAAALLKVCTLQSTLNGSGVPWVWEEKG